MENKEATKPSKTKPDSKSKPAFSIQGIIVGTVITFVTLGILNFTIESFTQDNGAVRISPPAVIGLTNYISVEIINFSRKVLDGLMLSIPSSSVSSIVSSGPIQIELLPDSVGTNQVARIKLSGIEPRSVGRIWIPVPNANSEVHIVNGADKRIRSQSGNEVENPSVTALKTAATNAIIS